MTEASERNVRLFISDLIRVRRNVDSVLQYISDVQSDTYKKEWEDSIPLTEEECLYEDRQRVADRLVNIYNDIEYVVDNLQGSLEGVERCLF